MRAAGGTMGVAGWAAVGAVATVTTAAVAGAAAAEASAVDRLAVAVPVATGNSGQSTPTHT